MSLNSEGIIENLEHQHVCEHLHSKSSNSKDTSCPGNYDETLGILARLNILSGIDK